MIMKNRANFNPKTKKKPKSAAKLKKKKKKTEDIQSEAIVELRYLDEECNKEWCLQLKIPTTNGRKKKQREHKTVQTKWL